MTEYGTKLRQLRDLIEDIGEEFYSDTATTCDFHTYLADKLLYSGVILPPCKVGDTIYIICGNQNVCDFVVAGYHVSDTTEYGKTKHREYLVCTSRRYPHSFHTKVSGLGKTVFLTREEAEAALEKLGVEVNNDR